MIGDCEVYKFIRNASFISQPCQNDNCFVPNKCHKHVYVKLVFFEHVLREIFKGRKTGFYLKSKKLLACV